MFEIAVYGSLAALVAAVVLLANGRPWWHAAAVIMGAGVLIGVLAIVSSRSGSDPGRSTAHVRRRRRH